MFQQYADEGREVAVVSEEQVKKLTELDDANQKLQATLEKTKYDTLSNLAPVFTQIAEAMQKARGTRGEDAGTRAPPSPGVPPKRAKVGAGGGAAAAVASARSSGLEARRPRE